MPATVDDIIKDGITEVIATTMASDGKANAAPMGIVRKGDRFFIRMFTDTTTFKNVLETGRLAANFTADSRVYVISTFRDLPPEYFMIDEGAASPRLKDADGWVYFKCKVTDVVALEPEGLTVARCTLPAFNRGFSAVVEATIVGTRLRLYKGDEGKKKIAEYEAVVKKCGSPTDIEAMKLLKEILGID